MNGAFKAVEHMGPSVRTDFKTLVVVVATHFTLGHNVLCREDCNGNAGSLRTTRISSTLLSVIS